MSKQLLRRSNLFVFILLAVMFGCLPKAKIGSTDLAKALPPNATPTATATAEAITGLPRILFSDLTDAPVTGWEGSATKGAAVSIFCRNIGSVRGTSYVTVGGIDLKNESDYAEWGAYENPVVPIGIRRITFYLNSSMLTGGSYPNTTIAVTTSEGVSSTIPFHTRLLGQNHIYFIDNVGGAVANDGLATSRAKRYPAWFRKNAIAGDVAYIRGRGVKYSDHDNDSIFYPFATGGLFTFANNRSSDNHAQGVEGRSISVVAYPGEKVEMEALELNVCHKIITWVYGHVNYWTFAKIFFNAHSPVEARDQVFPPYYSGFSHLRFVNMHITTPWHDNTDGAYMGLGIGMNIVSGENSDHFSLLGSSIIDVGQDYRGQPPTDPDGVRLYNIYFNGYGQLDYLDIGWNEIGWNSVSRGIQLFGHKETDSLDHAYIHDNYIHDVARQGLILNGEGGAVNYSFVKRAYIYNNIFTRIGRDAGDAALAMGGSLGNGKYGGTYYVYHNVFDGSSHVNYPTLHVGYDLDHLYLQNNIIIGVPNQWNYYTYYPSIDPIPVENVTASNNLYYGAGANAAPLWDSSTLGNTLPQFIVANPYSFLDFQIEESSPVVNAGADLLAFPIGRDFFHNSRVGKYDIGAFVRSDLK
ncbi:MAG: hypothetical protein A2504_01735 [Bdellovibrionales bacterium RIFOXYD12_FULL_39_22]|nr:MAG: hypothetical protein A2385_04260 [Bdellovibrionales bacterium RIFOXYB1_FULL_39_21]OFZ42373.1 MAG: hypothetical protein A2485_15235 [Bdellovibrionales bacterium RIFOXYC12_FULL_39_17]OFZ46326.1 MAG: hypothetical protein A2404_13780 [Bdellovibrionales bacterium RIFOXYC1_FULL_39_130]OFZ75219.1 MAG: hypothetical protein A2560_15835 [Bdellovibrionales bacterium RIFOXYD1_FULL_39_84]OFZ93213.1 MAG: hypothetical protein A2504_01735 [Bdellovibrionales bacterium RIFOXYD12_FULL_39_22]HLE11076.1 hy